MKERDVEGARLIVVQRSAATDVGVVVRAAAEHYRALRLSLGAEGQGAVYSARLEAGAAGAGVALSPPRLPADNRTYVLRLECALSGLTHDYDEPVLRFVSDGARPFRGFEIDFVAKVGMDMVSMRKARFL